MIVVSDMMGTLTTGSPVLGLVDWVRHNQSSTQARLYMISITPKYILAKRGLIDWQKWGQDLMINSLKMVKDATPDKMKLVGEWAVEHNLWQQRREDVIARTKGPQVPRRADLHCEQRGRADDRAVRSPHRGADHWHTGRISDGQVRVAGELVAQERKIEQVLSRLAVDRLDFAYGDTAQDIPMLEHADHPVAVYPDEKLKAAALERGWEILGDKSS